MKWADYCVSKLSLDDSGFIDNIVYYEDLEDKLGNKGEFNRTRMVGEILKGKTFCSIKKNLDGTWSKIGNFSYDGRIFSWFTIPKNITRRKTFLSYYHLEDQEYKERFHKLFDDLVVAKSVNDGDIDSKNSDEYIKKLIQVNHLEDTTILVVLIGTNTKHRKHIDWEIHGALNLKVGERYAGILALILPTHPDYKKDKFYYTNLPDRISANIQSDYAIIANWTEDRVELQRLIEKAYEKRQFPDKIINATLLQMTKNTNE